MNPVLLDASVLVSILDRTQSYHSACVRAVAEIDRRLITCEAVIAESCYLLRRVPGAAETILENLERGVFEIPFQLAESAAPVRSVMHKYRDHPIDFADACLIHLADQMDTGDILTLDRDFLHYRWRKTRIFELLVDLD